MKRDPAPTPAEVVIATAEILTAARKATSPGADPVAAVAAIREALAPLWPRTPPEAVRDAMVTAAEMAYHRGARGLPDGLADQTADWLMEMVCECRATGLGDRMAAPVAFVSSVAFDREEDAETFTSLAVVLAIAEASDPGRDPGRVTPSPWGHPEPAPDGTPDGLTNRDIEPEPADWHDGPDPEPYDPGPEVDDEGGMSEHRYHEPEPWQ